MEGKRMKNIIIICVGFIFFSCANLTEFTVQLKFDQKTFAEQKQLWQQANIKNYQYQLSAIGFIYYYGTIFVENGQIKSDLPSVEYSNIENFMNYSSIDEIYKTIEEILNSYNDTKQSKKNVYCTEIFVEYDKIRHIPIDIIYYYYTPAGVVHDGTFHYKIAEFSKRE
jgi:hypothetical protein